MLQLNAAQNVDILTILGKVLELFSVEERWTIKAQARDSRGAKVSVNSPTACSWCIEGAFGVVSNPHGFVLPAILQWLDALVAEYSGLAFERVNDFNDNVHYDVVVEFLQWVWHRTQAQLSGVQ